MQLCKVKDRNGAINVGVLQQNAVKLLLSLEQKASFSLSEILHSPDPASMVEGLLQGQTPPLPLDKVQLLAPIDHQEVWAAGVTYKRSREARERESVGAARFYDLVYTAARPELFFKATAGRVVGPGDAVRVRCDSQWSVPEPELALILSPQLRLVGYTIGNDMSARDIEGENPLYLPQAKVYDASCALGPVITLAHALPPLDQVSIRLTIERDKKPIFDGSTTLAAMARTFEDLIGWLGKENRFPEGVILLTGTGVVPPDHFSLAHGDLVSIEIAGIGKLVNPVVKDAGR
ncbi:MAG TPA: fumarylacetoacetate hydrolase family protein [Gemmataceae bacterium]|jgi:2-dehydro-3-deoxy-D-arabinonate dehydratase|nr:fumarylacetoacetate hydrolase family protein [Gemmataceae bacterium]